MVDFNWARKRNRFSWLFEDQLKNEMNVVSSFLLTCIDRYLNSKDMN